MKKILKRGLRWLKWPIRLLAVWFCLHTAWVLWDGFSDDKPENAVAVVLGNKVNPDGTPSPRLAARLDKALELYQAGQVQQIIVSGGLGTEGHLEGTVMKNYLVEKGIPARNLTVDDQGNTTWLTAVNSRTIFPDPETPLIVISQYYHISRSKLAMRRLGYENVGGVHANFLWEWRDIKSVIREFPAYYLYLLRQGQNRP